MSDKLKIVFIGGFTDGKIVFDYLRTNKYCEVVLVITYPDQTDRPRHINFPNDPHIIKSGKANPYLEQIKAAEPDFTFVAGWSELLDAELLHVAHRGTIGFHPSKLPMDRGRSVVAWQIESGYTDSALSMFYYTDIPDGGDIIAQEPFTIEPTDYLNDVLDKIDEASRNLMRAYFPLIRMGKAPRRPQSINEGNFRRLRTSADSQVDWNLSYKFIYNKIRAIAPPYPGAEATIKKKRYKLFAAEIVSHFPFGNDTVPGTLVATLFDGSMLVKCRDGLLRITKWEPIK